MAGRLRRARPQAGLRCLAGARRPSEDKPPPESHVEAREIGLRPAQSLDDILASTHLRLVAHDRVPRNVGSAMAPRLYEGDDLDVVLVGVDHVWQTTRGFLAHRHRLGLRFDTARSGRQKGCSSVINEVDPTGLVPTSSAFLVFPASLRFALCVARSRLG